MLSCELSLSEKNCFVTKESVHKIAVVLSAQTRIIVKLLAAGIKEKEPNRPAAGLACRHHYTPHSGITSHRASPGSLLWLLLLMMLDCDWWLTSSRDISMPSEASSEIEVWLDSRFESTYVHGFRFEPQMCLK